MTLPRKPERSSPIPNQPFESPEVTTVKGPYWDMILGEGLELDSDGSIIAPDGTGNTISDQATINSSYFTANIGKGLGVVGGNEFSRIDLPPYNCRTTDLYMAGVSNFNGAWAYCSSLTSFPLLDVSSGTNFFGAWSNCSGLTSFPSLDLSSGTNFSYAWIGCSSLTSFPLLDFSRGRHFENAWSFCSSLTSFPLLNVDSGLNFMQTWQYCTSLVSFPALAFPPNASFGNPGISGTWYNCSSLRDFPPNMFDNNTTSDFSNVWYGCALSQTSVNNILISLDTAGQSNGTVNLNGGTSAAPSGAGATAKLSLQGKGWTVITN